jgi:hypothetical protein
MITHIRCNGARRDNSNREEQSDRQITKNAARITEAESTGVLDRSVDELTLSVRGHH